MEEHKSIIRGLLASGMTQAEIGAAVGRSQAWVAAVMSGAFKDIKWGDGIRLREIAASRGIWPELPAAPQRNASEQKEAA